MKAASFFIICVFISIINSQPPPDDVACFQGNKVSANECCLLPRFVDKAINTKCDDEYKPLSPRLPPGIQAYEGSCVIECLFSTSGMSVDGKVIPEKMKQVLAKTIGADTNFGPLLNGIVDACHIYVMGNPAYHVKPVPVTPGRAGCSFVPQAYMNCVKSKLFEQCPKGIWTAADGCEQIKQKMIVGCSYYSILIGIKGIKG